ncbi:MAG TPA: LTA synthase family protein, partial [Microlunatus sp.]|nr:LTA synthase family protein [Microlunatus sp.]
MPPRRPRSRDVETAVPRPSVLRRAVLGIHRNTGLTADQVIGLVCLTGPLVGYLLVLKAIRIADRGEPVTALAFLGLIRSDLFTGLAVAVTGVAVMALAAPGRPRRAAFGLISTVAAVIALLQTLAHVFFLKTGSPLDLAVAAAAWSTRREIGDLVGTQVDDRVRLWLVAAGAWCLLGPPLIVGTLRWRRAARGRRPGRRPRPRPVVRHPARHRVALGAAALAGALLFMAALPGATGTSFARDPLLNAALSPLEARRYAQAASADAVPPAPLHTRLSRTTSGRPPNVVLIFLESVRAISTSIDDSQRGVTPYLSRLARTSLVAENAYTVVPHTSKALTAGHCGIAPPMDMNVTEAQWGGISGRCLPALLAEQGYATAFFQSATEHYDDRRELVRNLGYADFLPVDVLDKEGYVRANYFGWEDDILLEPSRTWLTRHADQPFLTGYLTVTSHHDYEVPSTIDREHLSDDPEVDDYLNTVRYGDRFVQRLIQQYKDLGLYDDTVFVVMADHGEGFGEHGVRQHDNTIYTEGVKIPLLVHDPRRPQGRRITGPVQLTSVLPTVVARLAFEVNGGHYPAGSLDDPTPTDRVRIACYVDNACLASITGTQKYVFHFGRQPDEF